MPLRKLNYIESEWIENMNAMVQFSCEHFSMDKLKQAIRNVKRKQPYLRMKIIKNENGEVFFHEQNPKETDQIHLVIKELEAVDELNDWKPRMEKLGSTAYEVHVTTVKYELYYFKHKYQLFMNMSHHANDGIGTFSVIKDILHYLDLLLSNKEIIVEKKSLLNHLKLTEDPERTEKLKKEKVLTDYYHRKFKHVDFKLYENPMRLSKLNEFYQFDDAFTMNLIKNCRLHKSTIQGVLSAVTNICFINECIDISGLDNETEVLSACPINMRHKLGLQEDDLVFGGSSLFWRQKISGKNEPVWTLVRNTTENVHKLRNSNNGFDWWIKVSNKIPYEDVCIKSSSIGVINIGEKDLVNIKIEDLAFSSGNYRLIPNIDNFIIIHAFTFMNKFTITMAYNYESLGKKWGEHFFGNLIKILDYLSKNSSDKITISDVSKLIKRHNH